MSVKNYSNTVDLEKIGIPKIKGDISALNSSVNDLAVVVGNDTSGLVKAVDDLEGVVGDSGSGLVRAVDMLSSEVEDMAKLPDVTSADNGKVLKVANGAWGVGTDNSLPDVTSADEGKIIRVNSSGEWTLDNLPSSGGMFILYGYYFADNSLVHVNGYQTWGAACQAALDSGLPVVAYIGNTSSSTSYKVFICTQYYNDSFAFSTINHVGWHHDTMEMFVFNTGTSDYTNIIKEEIYTLPSYSTSDAGKILKVNSSGNGLEWVTPS